MIRAVWERLKSRGGEIGADQIVGDQIKHGRMTAPGRGYLAVPPDLRVYAIGDIHGQYRALDTLHHCVLNDAAGFPGRKLIIYLGDYVDRGDDSAGILDRLTGPSLPGFERHCLRGNHEEVMLGFLAAPSEHAIWLDFGGRETLASYGVAAGPVTSSVTQDKLNRLSRELNARLPDVHRAFLAELPATLELGDYLFVHAGVRPGCPLDSQAEQDLLWIREPFLSSPLWHGKRIVHGHTIVATPEVLSNRIGIDTGAYAGGPLTCLVLEGGDHRFLQAGGED